MITIEETATKFTSLLKAHNIKYSIRPLFDGYQWKFNNYNGDIAIHSGTYHNDEGYLESYEMPWDDGDVSICTPEEMIRRLEGKEPHVMAERVYTIDDTIDSLMTMKGI